MITHVTDGVNVLHLTTTANHVTSVRAMVCEQQTDNITEGYYVRLYVRLYALTLHNRLITRNSC